jgi:hypothetical protein
LLAVFFNLSLLLLVVHFSYLLFYIKIRINICEKMICLSMTCFISSYWHYDLFVSGFFIKLIVQNCFLWGWHLIPMMKRSIRVFYVLQHFCVSFYSLFLQVTNKSMAELRVQQVRNKERVHEDSLERNYHCSLENCRFF